MPFIQDCWTNQWLADNLPPSLNSLYKINLYPKYDDSYLDPTLNPINESLDDSTIHDSESYDDDSDYEYCSDSDYDSEY